MIGVMRHAAALTALLAIATVASAETHKFKPTAGVTTFTARPPVLTIKPGDTVETETFSRPGDYYDSKVAGPWPGEWSFHRRRCRATRSSCGS